MSAQYRTHMFSVLICDNDARLFRWDYSGAIVTEKFPYNTQPYLFNFFIRFDRLPRDVQGRDTTVRPATTDETKDAVKAAQELGASKMPLLVVSVPNPATGQPLEYIIASPRASPYVPVGRWTRTSIGYDVQRKGGIFMKDSWRLVMEGARKEGIVYSRFEANGVPNVPHCSNSGDVGDDAYHSTRTDHYARKAWIADYEYGLISQRHYCLILDGIGQPLDSFRCSRDMVRAVHAALVYKFFLDKVEVCVSESCTPMAHKFAYKCEILHRDISPGNILITSDNKFEGGLLIDWDLCKDMNTQVHGPHHAVRTVRIKYLSIRWVLINWT